VLSNHSLLSSVVFGIPTSTTLIMDIHSARLSSFPAHPAEILPMSDPS
jgi:hypothetical protein